MNNMEILSDALEYIERHMNEEITPENVAEACYCSKSYLQKIFKFTTRHSVKDYIIKRRMTKAAKELVAYPNESIINIAFKYCYGSPEAFVRAFEQIWHCKPSVFRKEAKFTDLYPRQLVPFENGDDYMNERKHVDISDLYDLFRERKECYFICCDIKSLVPINEISFKAGDLAILEALKRMENAAGKEDIVFRIGGDEFVLLTNSKDVNYAQAIVNDILKMNGNTFDFEGKEIPLNVYAGITKFDSNRLKYDELFVSLHTSIKECK